MSRKRTSVRFRVSLDSLQKISVLSHAFHDFFKRSSNEGISHNFFQKKKTRRSYKKMIVDVKMQTIKRETGRSLTGDRPLFLALMCIFNKIEMSFAGL
jgi:hypothetical protein